MAAGAASRGFAFTGTDHYASQAYIVLLHRMLPPVTLERSWQKL
jgi:hypothetical protein